MTDASGRSLVEDPMAYHQKYHADARAVLDIFGATGTRVYFAGAPLSRKAAETDPAGAAWLNELYASASRQTARPGPLHQRRRRDPPSEPVDTRPCRACPTSPAPAASTESGTPVNVVHAPDGGHFCPGAPDATRGVTETCPVWSSGAYRYANTMAAPVVRDLGHGSVNQ